MKYCYSADGLRGVAALNVTLAHFVCAFLPSLLAYNYPTHFSSPANPSTIYELASSPILSLFYNGELAVIIFFVLSGYVLTIPYFEGNTEKLKRRLWGRYLRLGIPVAAISLIAFFLLKSNLFFTLEAAEISGSIKWLKNLYSVDLAFLDMLGLVSYKTLFFGDSTLNTAFWTLKVEFIGSMLLLAFYVCKPRGHEFILTFLVCLVMYLMVGARSIYYISLFLGALINLAGRNVMFNGLLFFVACYLGAFQYKSVYYDFLPEVFSFQRKSFYNLISALLLVYIVKNGFMERILESKPFKILGKLSFSLYLVHTPILCSIIAFLYVTNINVPYMIFWIFATYLILVLVASALFYKYVDKLSIKLSGKLSSKLAQAKI